MAAQITKRFILDEYRLEPETRLLIHRDEVVHLPHRPFQVLLYLIEHRDRLVSRAELLDLFWEGRDVYDVTLTKCVGKIRKALDDQLDNQRFIETRYADGYRFIGPLEEQLVNGEQEIVDIERTRGVKIVVEEEEIHHSARMREASINLPADLASNNRGPSEWEEIENGRALKIAMQDQEIRVGEPLAQTHALSRPAATSESRARHLTYRAVTVILAVALIAMTGVVLLNRNGRSGSAGSPLTAIHSIAVLPLRNRSGDASSEYFSDGMTDSLIAALAQIDGLKVISRGSVFNFKDKEVDPREIGKKLGVGAVLEGSVDKTDKSIRVAVRLVSTNDGSVLWTSGNYDRADGDIFAIQDEIALGVASGLRLKLSTRTEQKVIHRHTNNRDAYEAYLKGRYYWNERAIPNALDKAIRSFKDAVEKDPNYALAYSGLADSYVMSYWYTPMSSNEAFIKARQAAAKAVQLDDTLSEAHTSMAAVAENEWNWKVAQTEYQRAIELNPNYATAHHWYALHLIVVGKPEQAIEEIHKAKESDPLSLPINADVGYILFCARRYDEAITEYRQALELNSDFPMALEGLAQTYVKSGKPKEAVALIAQLPADSGASSIIGYIYGVAGERDEAKKILAGEMQRSTREYVSPTRIALIHVGLGDTDRAMFWLEKSYREHSPDLMIVHQPFFDSIRSDPRFADLATRVGP